MICWHCHKRFIPHPVTGNCLYCARMPEEKIEKAIEKAKKEHDILESNPQSYGSDKSYPIRRKNKA